MAEVLIFAGYGLNCEEETLFAFERSGLSGKIMHINDVIETPDVLKSVQILAIPGGFSYGDDTGAGNGYAQKIKLALWDHIKRFSERDTLTIGICNGCQILANLGMVHAAGSEIGTRNIAVTYNKTNRYQCRWIDLEINSENKSPWLADIETLHIPVAHGEGRFMMADETLASLKSNHQIAARYIKPDGTPAHGEFPFNPNGSLEDIAAMTDPTGKILAIMPHPERGMFVWQRNDYAELKDRALREKRTLQEEADGLAIFKNAARHFEVKQKKSA